AHGSGRRARAGGGDARRLSLADVLARDASVDQVGRRVRSGADDRAGPGGNRCGADRVVERGGLDADAAAARLPARRADRVAVDHRRVRSGDRADRVVAGRAGCNVCTGIEEVCREMRIDVSAVSKRFDEFTAVEDVTLSVAEGSLTALLGPSGSGKSTLLRIVAGLEIPDAGSVSIDGNDVTQARPQDRGIGFVFQHYAAFTHMTVWQNVAFGLRIRKRPRPEVRERVDELLALVGLTKWADQRPHQLSGGQRQRMALARALAVQPRVLLLDEPFGALDANVRAELRRWLRRLHDEQGVTTVLVTHDQEEAMEVADTIAVMNEGRIEQVGSPRDVYDRPANDFVMSFLGPVSTLNGKLVRPHDVTVSLTPQQDALEAMVSRVVHLGFEVRIELELPDGSRARAQLTRGQTAELELARGDIVYVRPPEAAAPAPAPAKPVESRAEEPAPA